MSTPNFAPGDRITVTWTSLKRQHTGRIITPDNDGPVPGYLVEYDDMPGERWIPATGIEPLTDGETGQHR